MSTEAPPQTPAELVRRLCRAPHWRGNLHTTDRLHLLEREPQREGTSLPAAAGSVVAWIPMPGDRWCTVVMPEAPRPTVAIVARPEGRCLALDVVVTHRGLDGVTGPIEHDAVAFIRPGAA